MKITGTLTTIGDITTVTNFSEDIYPENYETETTPGIFIAANVDILRAASNLLYCTVDIYPHPVNELIAGKCTPDNYAHAMARLAHAEDHLAREVRSSQALLAKQAEQERLLSIYRTKYHEADRALQQAHNEIAKVQAAIAQHPPLPAGALEELVNALAGCCSWSLNVNDYRSGYETIRQYLTNCASCGSEDPDDDLIAACEASGALYELQVYERTPVSFILVKAPSFAKLLDEVRDHKWEHISPVMLKR